MIDEATRVLFSRIVDRIDREVPIDPRRRAPEEDWWMEVVHRAIDADRAYWAAVDVDLGGDRDARLILLGRRGERADLHLNIATGFVEVLVTLDIEGPPRCDPLGYVRNHTARHEWRVGKALEMQCAECGDSWQRGPWHVCQACNRVDHEHATEEERRVCFDETREGRTRSPEQ